MQATFHCPGELAVWLVAIWLVVSRYVIAIRKSIDNPNPP